jgi:hypothetical protein
MLSCGACDMGNAKAHAPFRACGQYISDPAGSPVEKLQPGTPAEPINSNGLILQLVPGCAHGADIAIAPSNIIRIRASIRAADGKLAAIGIEYPGQFDPRFHGTLTVSQDHNIVGVVAICACVPPTTITPGRSLFSPGE